ncbi:MAG: carbohydrate-binding protein [Bryobacteraceae bacterium]
MTKRIVLSVLGALLLILSAATATGTACYTAWVSTTAYSTGNTVSYSGVNYTAAFWSQGSNPSTNNGGSGSGEPWISNGACSGSGTATATATKTATATATKTATATATATGSKTATATATKTATATATATAPPASGFIFSPYKDVTVDANWNTGAQQTTVTGTSELVTLAMPNRTLTWAFATGTCGSETWAGITVAQEATNVATFVSAGKDYIVSTGGAAGSFDCPSSAGLVSFINSYYSANMQGVDFDIESGQTQTVINDLVTSAKGAESSFPNMRFSFTLASFGGSVNPILGATGVAVVNEIKSAGLGGNYTVNPMAFDFGAANPTYCVVVGGVCEMGQSAIQAMESVSSQFGIPYGHIEVTIEVPADDGGASFTMADVTTLCNWIKSNGAAGIHYWSLDRDTSVTYAKAIMSACGAY